MIIKKRQLLMATLVLALAAAVFVNWYYTRPAATSVANAETKAQSRRKRRRIILQPPGCGGEPRTMKRRKR